MGITRWKQGKMSEGENSGMVFPEGYSGGGRLVEGRRKGMPKLKEGGGGKEGKEEEGEDTSSSDER